MQRAGAGPSPAADGSAPDDDGESVQPVAILTLTADGSAHGGTRGREVQREAQDCAEPEGESKHFSAVSCEGSGKPSSGGDLQHAHATVLIEDAPASYFSWSLYFSSYFKKWKGGLDTSLPLPPLWDVFWSWLGAFLSILAIAALNQWVTPQIDIPLLVGSFGASAVLVFGMIESKLAQPRNFIGGQLLSAVIGVTVRLIIHTPWIAAPVAMSLALSAMQLTRTTHPPGGATALIAASMTEMQRWHGYSYLVTVALGTLVMQIIALVVNNLAPHRRYPTFWL